MEQNGSKWLKKVQNGSERFKMVHMVQNSSKWFKLFTIILNVYKTKVPGVQLGKTLGLTKVPNIETGESTQVHK